MLAILNHEPHLIVLDGLERILIAYARMDAARLDDAVVGDTDLKLRKTTDPRAGKFLSSLLTRAQARILIITRLYPADLEDKETGGSLHAVYWPHRFSRGRRFNSMAGA